MKVLVACEESQAVTKELRKLGHEAYSCDIIECSGGHPEWHIQKLAHGYHEAAACGTGKGQKQDLPRYRKGNGGAMGR